jgi:hypothetical protein
LALIHLQRDPKPLAGIPGQNDLNHHIYREGEQNTAVMYECKLMVFVVNLEVKLKDIGEKWLEFGEVRGVRL